jgi:16S rRNA A1518/A1519 N6-dimethyltransferase RsmA/KsgA/DIM1 with predicted DNA glycosylase/AP lyase activity
LHLTRRTKPFISLDSIGRYESFLRNLFGQKRKQIGKILMSYYSQERMETYPDWISLKTRRSETLSQSEVMAIFRWITP